LIPFVSGDWMAESLREEWSVQINLIVGGIIGWDGDWRLLASSPLAWSDTGNISLGSDAISDDVEVFGDISWGTEVVIWDHGSTVGPFACCLLIAISSSSLGIACLEVSLGGVTGNSNWMAELFGEEWGLS